MIDERSYRNIFDATNRGTNFCRFINHFYFRTVIVKEHATRSRCPEQRIPPFATINPIAIPDPRRKHRKSNITRIHLSSIKPLHRFFEAHARQRIPAYSSKQPPPFPLRGQMITGRTQALHRIQSGRILHTIPCIEPAIFLAIFSLISKAIAIGCFVIQVFGHPSPSTDRQRLVSSSVTRIRHGS